MVPYFLVIAAHAFWMANLSLIAYVVPAYTVTCQDVCACLMCPHRMYPSFKVKILALHMNLTECERCNSFVYSATQRVLGCVSVQVKIVCIDGWSSGKLTPRRFSSCIQVTVQTGNGSHDLVERNQYCTRLWHWLGIFSHSDGGSTLNLEHIVGSVPVHLHSYAKISVLAYSCYLSSKHSWAGWEEPMFAQFGYLYNSEHNGCGFIII
jgi:hypothetical protein